MPFGSFTVWHAQEKEQMQFKFLLHTEATLIILLIAYKRCGDRRFVFTEWERGVLQGLFGTCLDVCLSSLAPQGFPWSPASRRRSVPAGKLGLCISVVENSRDCVNTKSDVNSPADSISMSVWERGARCPPQPQSPPAWLWLRKATGAPNCKCWLRLCYWNNEITPAKPVATLPASQCRVPLPSRWVPAVQMLSPGSPVRGCWPGSRSRLSDLTSSVYN